MTEHEINDTKNNSDDSCTVVIPNLNKVLKNINEMVIWLK
jgi:hypothetical protein